MEHDSLMHNNSTFCALPAKIAIVRFLDYLFSCKGSKFEAYYFLQFVQPELVTIMEGGNVDKVCENKLLVGII